MRLFVVEHALAIVRREHIGHHDHAIGLLAVHRRKRALEVIGFAHTERS
jgi:hypothetical protein